MDVREMRELFSHFTGTRDFLSFDKVESPRSRRPDLHAFLLLDSLVPGVGDLVSDAEHDEIYLGIQPGDLAAVVTEAQILELVRCGVRYGEYGLCMFV